MEVASLEWTNQSSYYPFRLRIAAAIWRQGYMPVFDQLTGSDIGRIMIRRNTKQKYEQSKREGTDSRFILSISYIMSPNNA